MYIWSCIGDTALKLLSFSSFDMSLVLLRADATAVWLGFSSGASFFPGVWVFWSTGGFFPRSGKGSTAP